MTERNRDSTENTPERAELGRERTEASPPPGAGVVNSTRTGQANSENPVLRTDREAGDVLGDRLLEKDLDENARRGKGMKGSSS